MENSELNNLMDKIRDSRDELAFSKIFDYLAPKINGYFIKNGLQKELSEELTQEVMSTIWAKSHLYDQSKASLSTWVFTISRNKKVDFLRKSSKIDVNEEDLREFMYSDNKYGEISETEIKDQITRINSELSEDQKKLIKMNFFENKSHKIIAEELEIPIGTVKSRIRHLLIKMQKFLI